MLDERFEGVEMLLGHSVGVRLVNARYLFCYLVHHIPDHILGKDFVPVVISLLEYKSIITSLNQSELTYGLAVPTMFCHGLSYMNSFQHTH
jgi:hypothetical protein